MLHCVDVSVCVCLGERSPGWVQSANNFPLSLYLSRFHGRAARPFCIRYIPIRYLLPTLPIHPQSRTCCTTGSQALWPCVFACLYFCLSVGLFVCLHTANAPLIFSAFVCRLVCIQPICLPCRTQDRQEFVSWLACELLVKPTHCPSHKVYSTVCTVHGRPCTAKSCVTQ